MIARAIVLYYALVGIWGVFLAIRKADLPPAYRGALFIGVVMGVIQAAVGLTLLFTGAHPRDGTRFCQGDQGSDRLRRAIERAFLRRLRCLDPGAAEQ